MSYGYAPLLCVVYSLVLHEVTDSKLHQMTYQVLWNTKLATTKATTGWDQRHGCFYEDCWLVMTVIVVTID